MGRIRTIKPEFWTSPQIVECSPLARLLFIGIWNFCDDGGILPASPKRLKMLILPGDDIGTDAVAALVSELVKHGLLECYTARGGEFWRVTGWSKHQRIDQPTFRYPAPNGVLPSSPIRRRSNSESTPVERQPFPECSPNDQRTFGECSPPEGKGMERDGKEKSLLVDANPASTRQVANSRSACKVKSYPEEFEKMWAIYPKRLGSNPKLGAFKAWNARIKEGAAVDAIFQGTKRYAAFITETGKQNSEFILQAATFLGPNNYFREAWAIPSDAGMNRKPATTSNPWDGAR